MYLRFHRKEAKRDKVSVKHDTQTVIPQEKWPRLPINQTKLDQVATDHNED